MSVEKRIRSRRRIIAHERNVRMDIKLKQLSFVLTTMIIIAGASGLLFSNQVSAAEEPIYEIEIVNAGDTIWEIAEKHNQDGNDLRKYVDEICKSNNIEDYIIYPGQAIKCQLN